MTTNSTDTCIEFRGNTNGTGEKRSLRVSLNEKLRNVFYGITGENILSKNILLSGGIAAFIENYFRLEKMQVNVLMGEKDGFPGLLELELDTKLAAIKDVVFGFTDKFQAESGNVSGFNPEKILRSNVFFSFSESANRNELPFAENALLFSFDFSVDAVSLELRWHDGKQDPSSISEFLNHFLGFFEEVLVEKRAIRDSSFFSIDWSKRYVRNGASGSKNPLSVLDRFHAICESFPSQISILHEDEQLTYEELQQRSSTVANWLRSKGVQRGDLIYTHMKRSPELIIVLLGIIKTGAFFSMLEPDLSLQRKRDILDVDPGRFVIGEENLEGELIQLPNYAEMSVVLSGPVESVESMEEFIPLETDRLYMIFTSGTTGQPKGVVVRNKSFGNRMNWMHKQYDLNRDSVTLVKSSLTFDPFICEVFRSLTSGATLGIVPGHENVSDPSVLLKYTAKYKATNMDLVASPLKILAHYLVENPDESSKAQSLKHIFAGAEPLDSRVWSSISQSLCVPFGTTLINTWGATETTVDVTAFNCGDSFGGSILPVGYPIDGVELLLLDEWGVQVPDGIVGELYIGGEVLAEGYFKDSDLTSRKFVRLPDYGGGVYYKSGDYAYNTIDGPTYFLGRKDDQLKINGFRIELTDIINRIQKIEGVENVAVTFHETDGLMLAIKKSKQDFPDKLIRDRINEQLTTISYTLLFCDEIPLTLNEKVDWRAIRSAFPSQGKDNEEHYDHPIADIWREIFQRPILYTSDFFELGGDSIGIALVKMKLKKRFDIDIPIEKLFDHSDLRSLILLIDNPKDFVPKKLGLVRADLREGYPLSSRQHQVYFDSQFEGGNIAYNESCSFKIQYRLEEDLLKVAIENIVKRHEILRTAFRFKNEKELFQYILDFDWSKITINFKNLENEKDVIQSLNNEIGKLKDEEFKFSEGYLFRIGCFQTGKNETVFTLVMHHTITDAWSLNIFAKELIQRYEMLVTGKPFAFEALNFQYKDFAVWEQNRLVKNDASTDKKYWLNQLEGMRCFDKLPYSFELGNKRSFKGNRIEHFIADAELENFKRLLEKNHCTLFMGFLAATKILLYKHSKVEDIVVGTPVLGREDEDILEQIGIYTNTIALRSKLNDDTRIDAFFKQIKKIIIEGFVHGFYPINEIGSAIDLDYTKNRNPFFEVTLGFQNPWQENSSKEDRFIEEYFYPYKSTSKFHLAFNFSVLKDGVMLDLEYSTDMFSEQRAKEILESFLTAINDLSNESNEKIGDLNEYVFSVTNEEIQKDSPDNSSYSNANNVPQIESVKEVWAQVLNLNVSDIDIEKDFFELGGKSLQCLVLIESLKQRLDMEISVNDFYNSMTIKSLCGAESQTCKN